jgi:hypothetical protein
MKAPERLMGAQSSEEKRRDALLLGLLKTPPQPRPKREREAKPKPKAKRGKAKPATRKG